MADKIVNESVADKLNSKLEKSGKLVFAVCVAVAVIVVAVIAVSFACGKSAEAGIEQVDSISYELTKDAQELKGDELAARQNAALDKLAALSEKSGIVGIRANMLIADLKFAQKKYDEAKVAYVKAAEANKKAYTVAVAYFNAGVCAEELNDLDSAAKYYGEASADADFVLADHALFSLGRVNETKAAYADAKAAYEKLNDLHPTSSWGQMAKSRLLALKAAGNIQ
ncbi:MAG: tetratricopeptide repeat protein [Treponema sp.]|nr:tetratricopeptide repeat protein [Candidatus Treponema equifaecale]